MKTVVSRRFMRGTDPIKSTWVYPKLISNICYLYSNSTRFDRSFGFPKRSSKSSSLLLIFYFDAGALIRIFFYLIRKFLYLSKIFIIMKIIIINSYKIIMSQGN
jgi:hypothetical protein